MQQIKLGTIGSGSIVHSILDAVMLTEGIRLEAVYSRSREKGEKLAACYGAQKVYTDLEQFLADETVNCVYVASPNSLHYTYTKQALLAGKHVLCEKPFAPRAAEVRELIDLARERNLLLADATPTAYLPNLEVLRRQLPKIGPIRLVMGNYSQYSSRYDQLLRDEVTNVFNPAFAGGSLMDINYYNLYLNIALFGKPETAVYYPNLWKNGIDTSGSLVLNYGGFVSTNMGAKDTWGVNYFQIEGEKGYIYIPDGGNRMGEIQVVTKAGKEVFSEQDVDNRWFYEIQNVTPMFLAEDREALEKRLEITADTVEVMEKVRLEAGIRFPGDA